MLFPRVSLSGVGRQGLGQVQPGLWAGVLVEMNVAPRCLPFLAAQMHPWGADFSRFRDNGLQGVRACVQVRVPGCHGR